MIEIALTNQQDSLPLDAERLRGAVESVLTDAGVLAAAISIAVVDDATIHRLNRSFLQHDYPTDVLSFLLEQREGHLEGEIILGAEQAIRMAEAYGWPAEDELLLYAIHGTLHLVGYDDQDEPASELMRTAERKYLQKFGVLPSEPGRAV